MLFRSRITPENFRAAFICAGGWGQFRQTRVDTSQTNELTVRWGRVRLTEWSFDLAEHVVAHTVKVTLDGHAVDTTFTQEGPRVRVRFGTPLEITSGQTLRADCAR